jgi:subtilisin family serine protease
MPKTPQSGGSHAVASVSTGVEELLLAAMTRGDESMETGRYLVTYKRGVDSSKALEALGLRTALSRDFAQQAFSLDEVGDADAVHFTEIGVSLISGAAFHDRALSAAALDVDSPIESIDPEYFTFADNLSPDYLRGFAQAVNVIATESNAGRGRELRHPRDVDVLVAEETWGLSACSVPTSTRSGAGIKVAILDTGMDLLHPDFAGRAFTTATFVGEDVQDLNGHGTHVTGTACGPKAPASTTPRYGIAYQAPIFVGKVLTNSGRGTMAAALGGINWAISQGCAVINMSLGSQRPVQPAYTAAGQAALDAGCLIIAAAGNAGQAHPTGAPANSPTIVAVASVDASLAPSAFSCSGKIEIAGPGRDIFSSVPLPTRYGLKSGTSMAAPHVTGCAALLAQTHPHLRGTALRNQLLANAYALQQPADRVGAGLVQAPQ